MTTADDFWSFQDELDREVQRRDWERDLFEDEQRRSVEWEREHGWVPYGGGDEISLQDIYDDIERDRLRRPVRSRQFTLKVARRGRRGLWADPVVLRD